MKNSELLSLLFQETTVLVSSFGNDKSIGTENVNVDFEGSEVSINFNAKYILDVLNIIKKRQSKISLFTTNSTNNP